MLQYWRFYWPLALTGVAMVLSVQFQNAALARYPEAVTELAIYALGYGVFGFFRASLNFIAQLTTVFARSVEATRRCHRYVFGVSVLIMLPLIYLGHSDGGAWLLSRVFGTDVELTIRVQEYLIYLAPVVKRNLNLVVAFFITDFCLGHAALADVLKGSGTGLF